MNSRILLTILFLSIVQPSAYAFSALRGLVNGELGALAALRVAKANPTSVGVVSRTANPAWERRAAYIQAYPDTTLRLGNKIQEYAGSYNGPLNLKYRGRDTWIEAMFESGILEMAVDYVVGNDSTLRFDPDGITIKKPKPPNNGYSSPQIDSSNLNIDDNCYVSIVLCPPDTQPPGATIVGVKVFRSSSCPPGFYCAKYPLAPENIQTLDVVVWRPSKMLDSDCRVAFGYSTCFFDRAFEGGEYFLTFPDFTTFTHALQRQLFPGTGRYPISTGRPPVTQNVRIDKAADETLFFLDGVAETTGVRQTIRVPRNGNIWYNPGIGKNKKHPDWETALESGDMDDVEIPKSKRAQFYDKLFREIAEEPDYSDPVVFPNQPNTQKPPYDLSDPITEEDIDEVKRESSYYMPPKVQDFGNLVPETNITPGVVPISPFGPETALPTFDGTQPLNPVNLAQGFGDVTPWPAIDPQTPVYTPPNTNNPNNPTQPQEQPPQVDLPTFDAPTMNEILDPIKNMVLPFINYQAPAFAGTCPQPTFSYYETSFSFSIHCDFIEQNRAMIAGFMSVAWTIVGFLIVLRA